jgi:hypothetical protein
MRAPCFQLGSHQASRYQTCLLFSSSVLFEVSYVMFIRLTGAFDALPDTKESTAKESNGLVTLTIL